jgi:hypothetical protein
MHSAKVIARQVAEDAHPTVARHILVLNAIDGKSAGS